MIDRFWYEMMKLNMQTPVLLGSNFIYIMPGTSFQVYIIDYGLAKKFRDLQTHKHIPYR